jgi:hypothetical protein
MEKNNNGKLFLFIKRLTKILLWLLLVFIIISTAREMSNGKVVSKNAVKQTYLKESK